MTYDTFHEDAGQIHIIRKQDKQSVGYDSDGISNYTPYVLAKHLKDNYAEVKAAYEAYKDKGFGIVGISLDNNKEAWVGGIANLGMTWPQLSDLQGWGCAGAKLYGVNSIPATVQVAKDGTILAKNLRGEAIQEKLVELLK